MTARRPAPPTADYGSWASQVPGEGATVEAGTADALGEYAGDYDVEAINAEYRAAINAALPDGVVLAGSDFYGPALDQDRTWPGTLDIEAVVASVDFWAIAGRHEVPPAWTPEGGS